MSERSSRIESIDALRGLVMVIMVLDHARHAFMLGNPENLADTNAAWFLSRWVTHFCAPVFVFLAGTSAWLYQSRGRSKGEVSRFLITRGLWLVVLEVTVISFGWVHTFELIFWQVIAAIGLAMIVLGGALFLPRWLMLLVGLGLVFGQDFYRLEQRDFGDGESVTLYRFLHGGMLRPNFGLVDLGVAEVMVVYPLLVWSGVIMLGYVFGCLFTGEASARRWRFVWLGAVATIAFVVIRAIDGYGNVRPWEAESDGPVWMAFLKCEKYPPSVAFLLMTLGPALMLLGFFERVPGAVTRGLQVFGRVPMFFYILHIYILHCGSRLVFWFVEGEPVLLLRAEFSQLKQWGLSNIEFEPLPEGFEGFGLTMVFVITATCVAILYPLCRWYGGVKRRSKSALLSYL